MIVSLSQDLLGGNVQAGRFVLMGSGHGLGTPMENRVSEFKSPVSYLHADVRALDTTLLYDEAIPMDQRILVVERRRLGVPD